jgi:hypothetical protein
MGMMRIRSECQRTYCTCHQSSLELAWCILPLYTSLAWLRGAGKGPGTSQYECSLQRDSTVVCALEASHNACLYPYPPLPRCTVSFDPVRTCCASALWYLYSSGHFALEIQRRPKHGKLNARLCSSLVRVSPDDRRLMKSLALYFCLNKNNY